MQQKNFNVVNQEQIDRFMLALDGTKNKCKIDFHKIINFNLD